MGALLVWKEDDKIQTGSPWRPVQCTSGDSSDEFVHSVCQKKKRGMHIRSMPILFRKKKKKIHAHADQ
jgi:hypothetical protein